MRLISLFLISLFLLAPVSSAVRRKIKRVKKGITDIFSIRLNKGLRVLNLNGNNISNIDGLILPNSLKKLKLAGNNIVSISNLDLNDSLNEINLGSNDINSINISLNSSLKQLHLNSNEISSIESIAFNNNLELLNIGLNNLVNLDLLSIPLDLRVLALARETTLNKDYSRFHQLEELYVNSQGMQDYSDLILPDNLQLLRVGGVYLLPPAFGEPEHPDSSKDFSSLNLPADLKELQIKFSGLNGDDLATVNLPTNLKRLDLVFNDITTLDGIDFPQSLRRLDLRCNLLNDTEKGKIRTYFKRRNQKIKIKLGQQGANLFNCDT